MKKLLRKFIFVFLGVVGAFLFLFFFFVYPNDDRVPELPAGKSSDVYGEFVASVIKNKLPHSIDIDIEAYQKKLAEIDRLIEHGLLRNSERFTSKYQVLAPLGFYPWRLEALDGLAIPTEKILTVEVPIDAEWVEISVRGGLSARVTVNGVEGGEHGIDVAPEAKGMSLPAFLSKPIRKYLYINSFATMARWERHSFKIKSGSELQIGCKSHDEWCFIGDPEFFRTANGKKPRQTIMVMIDTLRADAVNAKVMPRLSSYAGQADHFVNAIAPGNMTSPSTNGVLACRTPTDLGRVAFAYTVGSEFREQFYRSRIPSFASMLQAEGIFTAMIGNISVVSEVFGVGVSHGFEQQLLVEPEGYETPLAIAEAIRWLKENKDKDFFLYIHLNNPHAPYKPPLKYLRQQFRGLNNLTSYPAVIRWLYRGEAAFADYQVGHLLDFLERSGLEKQINVVVTSDHGDQHTERRFSGNEIARDFSGVYFDHGATLLNDEIHVPLIIKTSNSSPRLVADYVSSLWIGKTILKMNGISGQDHCIGEDLLAFPSTDIKVNPSSYPIIGSEGFQARAVITENRYKYIKTYEPTEKRVYASNRYSGKKMSYLKHEQLYDLLDDPDESVDLLLDQPELLDRSRNLFKSYFSVGSTFELVLEAAGKATYSIEVSPGMRQVSLDISPGVSGEFERQLRLPFKYSSGMRFPQVLINGTQVPLRVTTLKLPLIDDLFKLPEESMGWSRPFRGPSAFIVRVLDERRRDRKISLGNPAFESVLREWGYLNEN